MCVCVLSSLEPQLNLSDISSHVLFPYYKGLTVTQYVRGGEVVSLRLSHTHTHVRERAEKEHKNKLNQVQDRPFIIITIFNKGQIR